MKTRDAIACIAMAAGAAGCTGGNAAVPGFRFDRYHTVAEFEGYVASVADRHPDLVSVVEIGRSRERRPILAVEINNPATGPAHEKPGFYVDGNIHGGEVLGGEGALFFIEQLLARYGIDATVTTLVDETAFYVVPLVNPDGRAISIDTPENHRWNTRPTDDDGDGLFDEDPPDDLDGDGRILRMLIPDPEGDVSLSPGDRRRLIRAQGDAPRYRSVLEGVDDDGDGRFNEDRVGGVDLNRNFPSNWSAAQYASGPFPLSEPESFALVEYITSRPNIAAIHTYHTSGGLILRFPTLGDQSWEFEPRDTEAYAAIAEDGAAATGYDNFARQKKPIVDLLNPGHGVFNDWAYNVFGVMAMTTEMWKRALGQGEDSLFAWNDEVLGGSGFIDWYSFDHPELGPVLLGGWDRWSTASPPEAMIYPELERNNAWALTYAAKLPRVAVTDVSAIAYDGRRFEVRADIANIGWMDTATAHAAKTLGIAQPVVVRLHFKNARLLAGLEETQLGLLPGTRGGEPEIFELVWQVRAINPAAPASMTIEVQSEKAGVARHTVELNAEPRMAPPPPRSVARER